MLLELQSCSNLQDEAKDSALPFHRHHDLVCYRLSLGAAKVSFSGHVDPQNLPRRYFSTAFDSH